MKKFNFDYDLKNDDLFIYLENKKSAGAVELGNIILDFDDNYNLVAMEIINVSEFLSKILSKTINLSNIKWIKMEVINFRNMDAIKFLIADEKTGEKTNILIPHLQ